MAPVFGYWQVQGSGQPSRMAIAFTGEKVEDTVYEFGAKEGTSNHWPSSKFHLGLEFPNLPYYIDGDLRLTQSAAILRYLGRKYKLYGSCEKEASVIDMLLDTSTDLRVGLGRKAYTEPNFEKMRTEIIESHNSKFQQLSDFLGSKKYLMGDEITIADFQMYDAIKWHAKMDEEMIAKHANLMEYIKRFESHEKIKAFLASDKAFESLFSPAAHWMGAK